MMLELEDHEHASFVTLTYSEDNLRFTSSGAATLSPEDLRNFFKRFRRAIAPKRIRYYACGEYGDQTERPHYHLALFGWPPCAWGRSRYTKFRTRCCASCDLLRSVWGFGNIDVGLLERASAGYVAGYVIKKMTSKDDIRLNGRYPEFSRQSRRPGIGLNALHNVASTLLQYELNESQTDVPSVLRHGSKLMPLGRYLRRKLRMMVGKDEKAPEEILKALEQEVRNVWFDSQVDEKAEKPISIREAVMKKGAQSALNLETRSKIMKSRRSI